LGPLEIKPAAAEAAIEQGKEAGVPYDEALERRILNFH